jgi:hypothetical protein
MSAAEHAYRQGLRYAVTYGGYLDTPALLESLRRRLAEIPHLTHFLHFEHDCGVADGVAKLLLERGVGHELLHGTAFARRCGA